MATWSTVATTAPSHSAPKSEYETVYEYAAPKSYGPALDSSAIIQPPATNSTSPTASATAYGSAGHQNRGLPYRQVSGSLPHITEPIATPIPVRNGSSVPTGGLGRSTSAGICGEALASRWTSP